VPLTLTVTSGTTTTRTGSLRAPPCPATSNAAFRVSCRAISSALPRDPVTAPAPVRCQRLSALPAGRSSSRIYCPADGACPLTTATAPGTSPIVPV
jgi:hypothetical protein